MSVNVPVNTVVRRTADGLFYRDVMPDICLGRYLGVPGRKRCMSTIRNERKGRFLYECNYARGYTRNPININEVTLVECNASISPDGVMVVWE